MNLTNYHSHSTFCDGHAAMEDFVQAAIAEGFTSYGFSSHAPLPYATRWNMDACDMAAYLAEASRLKKKYAGQIELYTGLEIDYLTDSYNPSSDYFRQLPLDFRIGSVHTVVDALGNIHEIDCKIEKFEQIVNNAFGGDVRLVTNLYIDRQMDMVSRGGIDIVGHADKMHYLAEKMSPGLSESDWYLNRMTEYLEVIARKGCIVEMNTKKWSQTGLVFPDERWHKTMLGMGIRVTVNSDAHYPDKINNGRLQGLSMLKSAGYRTVAELHNGQWTDTEINITI